MNTEMEVKVVDEQGKFVEGEHIKVEAGIGIYFSGSPTVEEWLNAVQGIEKFHGMLQFYLGDLMVYADSPVTGWGENKYQDLMEATGYAYDSLSVYSRVARRFPLEFRRAILDDGKQSNTYANVSFGHFQIVMPLGDIPAKHFLEMVRDGKWTIKKLREEVIKYKEIANVAPRLDAGQDVDEQPVLTLAQRVKNAFASARQVAIREGGETIRIQVVKNGQVISEELIDLEA